MPRPERKRFVRSLEETDMKRLYLGKPVFRQIILVRGYDIRVGAANLHKIEGIDQVEKAHLITQKPYGFRDIPLAVLNARRTYLTVTPSSFTFNLLTPWMDLGVLLAVFYTKV